MIQFFTEIFSVLGQIHFLYQNFRRIFCIITAKTEEIIIKIYFLSVRPPLKIYFDTLLVIKKNK